MVAETWTQRVLPRSDFWALAAFGSGLFVVASDQSRNSVAVSANGADWVTTPLGATFIATQLIHTGTAFILFRQDAVNEIYRSTDGLSWTPISFTGFSFPVYPNRVAHGNGRIVGGKSFEGNLAVSADHGLTWTRVQSAFPADNQLSSLHFANGVFLAETVNNWFYTSTNGLSWVGRGRITTPSTHIVHGIGGVFLRYTSGQLFTSTDGATWTAGQAVTNGPPEYAPMLLVGSTYVHVTNDRIVYTSPDGLAFTQQATLGALGGTYAMAASSAAIVIPIRGSSFAYSSDLFPPPGFWQNFIGQYESA